MTTDGKAKAPDGSVNVERVNRERSWANIVQGASRSPAWSSYRISEEDSDHLQQVFSKVLELLGELLNDSRL